MPTSGDLSTRTIVLSLVLGTMVLLVLAFALGGDEPATSTAVLDLPAATTSGAALPDLVADGAADPAIGARAPVAVGPALTGGELRIGDDPGPSIVVFLAHWCPHCQREAPVVQSWIDAGALDGSSVELLTVVTGIDPDQPNFPPDAWLRRVGWTSPALVDNDGTVAEAYGLSAFPFWVVLDDGEVLLRASGSLGTDTLDRLVAQLDAGR